MRHICRFRTESTIHSDVGFEPLEGDAHTRSGGESWSRTGAQGVAIVSPGCIIGRLYLYIISQEKNPLKLSAMAEN